MFFRKVEAFFTKVEDNPLDLSKALAGKIEQLKGMVVPPGELRPLTKDEIVKYIQIMDEVVALGPKFEMVLDKGISDLEVYGMIVNDQTGRKENIFTKFPTSKKAIDESEFNPDEHFGNIIKKAFQLKFTVDPETKKTGQVRSQANLDMLESYQSRTNGKENQQVGDVFLRALIDLRANQLYLFGPIILEIKNYFEKELVSPTRDDEMTMKIVAQLNGCFVSGEQTVESLKVIDQQDHLMSIKDFMAPIGAPEKLGLEPIQLNALKNIRSRLEKLEGSLFETVEAAFFKLPPLTEADRLHILGEIKKELPHLKPNMLPTSSPLVNPKFQENVDKLLVQVEYAMLKMRSAAEHQKTAQSVPAPGAEIKK